MDERASRRPSSQLLPFYLNFEFESGEVANALPDGSKREGSYLIAYGQSAQLSLSNATVCSWANAATLAGWGGCPADALSAVDDRFV